MRLLLYLSILLFPLSLLSQTVGATPGEEFPLVADHFYGVDEFKNLYYTRQQILYKQNSEREYQFSDIQLGAISSVDFINPLRITVFYDQFNTAVILDNTLNEITRVNFNQIEQFRNVSHARTASDRRLWIFNVDRQRLELFSYQSNTIPVNSPPLSKIPLDLVANFNNCWIYTGKALKTYNNYGSLVNDLTISDLNFLGQNSGDLWATRQNKVIFMPRGAQKFLTIDIAENQIEDLYYADKILYIYSKNVLKTYILNLPKK